MSKTVAAKKIAVLSLLTGLALLAFMVESLIPLPAVPGMNLGFANLFSLAALILYSPAEGFIVVAVRTLLGAVYAGNLSQLMYSLTGGVVSMGVSSLLLYVLYPRISVFAVSVTAAVFHNLTQCAVYAFVTNSLLAFGYAPYLAILGVVSGAVVGGLVALIFKSVPKNVFERLLNQKTRSPAQDA